MRLKSRLESNCDGTEWLAEQMVGYNSPEAREDL